MKKITKIKITLDIAMMIVLALMYSKSAINLAFHEIGGLAVIGAFVIHKALNFKWITGVGRKLFSKSTPVKTRVMYATDALLLVCFLIIGVSGALISKKVFHFEMNGMIYKTLHYTTSAIALILIGVHLGLHATFLGTVFKKIVKKPNRFIRPVGIALLVALVAFGAYNIASTSFVSWLSMPFRSSDMQKERRMPEYEDFAAPEGESEVGLTSPDGESEVGLTSPDGESETGPSASEGETEASNARRARKSRGEENSSPFKAILVFFQYFSIAMVFAAATWALERLARPKKRVQRA